MDGLTIRGDGRTGIRAWDGAKGTEPPASRYAAARLVTQHIGGVQRSASSGNLAASIDASGLIIVRTFDDPDRIAFSCRLREKHGVGLSFFGPEEKPWLFACWTSGMALFERSGEGFELLEEVPFDEDSTAWCAVLSGDLLYVAFYDSSEIALGRIEGAEKGPPSIVFPTGRLKMPGKYYTGRFAVGPKGEVACVSLGTSELIVVEADGAVRWKRLFSNVVSASGIAFSPGGSSLAVCDGPCVRELDAANGRDRRSRTAFEDGRHRPVRLLYAGEDVLAVGTYQTLALLKRAGDGALRPTLETDWLVPGEIDSICRSGSRFLFFFEKAVVSCIDGDVPYAGILGSQEAHVLVNLAVRGSTLIIGDGSGRPRSLDLADLSARAGAVRERKDLFSAPGWTDWRLDFFRSGGRSYSLWSNSLEDDGGGSSISYSDRLLRCAAFSEELGLAAIGDSDGRVTVHRCGRDGLAEEVASFEARYEAAGMEISNLLFAARGRESFLVCVTRRGTVARYSMGEGGRILGKPLLAKVAKESETDYATINTIFAVEGGFGFGVQHAKRGIQFFSLADLSELHPPVDLDTGFASAIVGGSLIVGSGKGNIFELPLNSLDAPPLRTKRVAIGGIRGIAATEDGRLLAVGGAECRIHLLDRATWDELAVIHLFDRDMIVATPPTDEDRAKGREFHAFYNPLRPDPTEDPRIAFYHSKGEDIRAGTGTRLDASKAEDRRRIAEYLETLYGTEAIASGDYGRRMALDAIWRPRRAAAALGAGSSGGAGNKPAGLISGGAGVRAGLSGADDGQEG